MKPKKCIICNEWFSPRFKTTEKCCSLQCEIEHKSNLEIKRKQYKPKPVSAKRLQQNKEYTKTRLQFISENELCERCRKPADEIHHKAGRNGERLNNVNDFMSVCAPCHRWIHLNPKESREKGWLL